MCLTRPSQRFPYEIEPVETCVAALKARDDAQRLRIVIKAAMRLHPRFQHFFPGMAKWCVAEVVRQRQRFGKIIVEAKRPGQRAGDLADLDRMRQAGTVVVALVRHENLGLVRQGGETPSNG